MTITLWTDNQTFSFHGSSVDCFNYVYHFLFTLEHKIELVVIACSKITHHMFVSVKEHDGHGVIEFIHRVEIWHLIYVNKVADCKVFHFFGDAVENFVHQHAIRVCFSAESNDNQAAILGQNSLVNMPIMLVRDLSAD